MDYNNFINQKVFNNKASKSGTIIKVERGYVFVRYDDETEDDNLHQFNLDSFNVGTLTLDNADLRSQLEQERLEKEHLEKERLEKEAKEQEEKERLSKEEKEKLEKLQEISKLKSSLKKQNYKVSNIDLSRQYSNDDLRKKFGINRQGFARGINNITDQDCIVLFSNINKEGNTYSYHDYWEEDGTFNYCGEGNEGDQTFVRGNKRLKDAITDGTIIHLFIKTSPNEYYYQGEFNCIDYKYENEYDANNQLRKEIRFILKRK